jgi:cytochrome c oxidase subunit 1
MPRRQVDYPTGFDFWNFVSSVGYIITLVGTCFFLLMLLEAAIRRRPGRGNPWGAGATTLEWTLTSPPPFHQFNELPVVHAETH